MAMREASTPRSTPPPDSVRVYFSCDPDLGGTGFPVFDTRAGGTRSSGIAPAAPRWAPLGRGEVKRPRLTHPAPVSHRDPCAVADLLVGIRYVFREGITG
jgi:hypothetical protein